MTLKIRICGLLLLIGFSTPGFAQWKSVETEKSIGQGFQARIFKNQPFYFCRDQETNFGFTDALGGCQLIYGERVLLDNYEILTDPQHNLGWKRVKGRIPIGAFDAGRAPLLGEKHLCLKKRRGAHYQGMVIGQRCHYRFKNKVYQTKNFQILVSIWAKTSTIPPELPPSGKDTMGNRYICRVRHQGIYFPGTTGRGERMCKFIDGDGYEMVKREDYEVQLHLPHKWVQQRSSRIFDHAVVVGASSPYFICRAPLLDNLYIGKVKKEGESCQVSIGGGHLRIKNYQLQVRIVP